MVSSKAPNALDNLEWVDMLVVWVGVNSAQLSLNNLSHYNLVKKSFGVESKSVDTVVRPFASAIELESGSAGTGI